MDLELLGSATDTRTFHWINSERHLGQRCFCLEILEKERQQQCIDLELTYNDLGSYLIQKA